MCRQRRFFLGFAAVAWVCVAVCAQTAPSAADSSVVVLDQKHATHRLLTQTSPEYPAVAEVNYLQGHVRLQLTVNGKGQVMKVRVLNGNAVLAAASLEAARAWTYLPLADASAFTTSVTVHYSLKSTPKELTPKQAEQDFIRNVKPAQVLRSSPAANPRETVHLRLLVNSEGRIDDIEDASADGARLEAALESVRSWTIRPARWGNLAVASYLDVNVPIGSDLRPASTATPPRNE